MLVYATQLYDKLSSIADEGMCLEMAINLGGIFSLE